MFKTEAPMYLSHEPSLKTLTSLGIWRKLKRLKEKQLFQARQGIFRGAAPGLNCSIRAKLCSMEAACCKCELLPTEVLMEGGSASLSRSDSEKCSHSAFCPHEQNSLTLALLSKASRAGDAICGIRSVRGPLRGLQSAPLRLCPGVGVNRGTRTQPGSMEDDSYAIDGLGWNPACLPVCASFSLPHNGVITVLS